MAKKTKKASAAGEQKFQSLDDVIAAVEKERHQANANADMCAHHMREITGFEPGKPLDGFEIVKLVRNVFDKHYVRRDGK